MRTLLKLAPIVLSILAALTAEVVEEVGIETNVIKGPWKDFR